MRGGNGGIKSDDEQPSAPAPARVFVDATESIFTVDERYLSWSFLPSEPDFSLAYNSQPLHQLLEMVGPAYFQWQFGNVRWRCFLDLSRFSVSLTHHYCRVLPTT